MSATTIGTHGALLLMGFLLGILALSGVQGESFITGLQRIAQGRSSQALALACTPDQTEEEEIFFLSCGGIF